MKKRKYQFATGMFIIISGFLSVFFLFIYPVMIATRTTSLKSIPVIVVALLIYFQLLILTVEYIHITFAGLYNLSKKRLFSPVLKLSEPLYPPKTETNITRVEMIIYIGLSYFFVAFTYAVTYLFLGNYYRFTFNESSINFSKAFYLSFTALTVGPSGLEPQSSLIRWIILSEIALGIMYMVLVFSLIATLIQKKQ